MKPANLAVNKAPFQHLHIASAGDATDLIRALEKKKDVTVRVVRGSKSAKVADLLDELSAALQFPHYFGHNWDSCADCLRDLGWISQAGVVIVFTDAQNLLKSAKAAEIATFKSVIADATEFWSESKKKARTLHVVYQAEAGAADEVARKWELETE